MSDDFGTVNVTRGQRAREIEVMRAHYRRHREALVSMQADAPTETLATAYSHLIREIDSALQKLDELEHRGTSGGTIPLVTDKPRYKTEPGARPLTPNPIEDDAPTETGYMPPEEAPSRSNVRAAVMIVVSLLVLASIAWLIWRGSSDREPAVVEQPVAGTDTAGTDTAVETPATVAPEPVASAVTVTPATHDYGVVRKGTRATRQFEIVNNGEEPLTVQVARSACRCLYYEYQPLIPPKNKETLTVTVDGAKAASGELRETVRVTAKSDPSVATSFDITATIR
jgi:hypothetical protein